MSKEHLFAKHLISRISYSIMSKEKTVSDSKWFLYSNRSIQEYIFTTWYGEQVFFYVCIYLWRNHRKGYG